VQPYLSEIHFMRSHASLIIVVAKAAVIWNI